MRLSIFTVQDHYPALPRTPSELYRQVIRQAELAEALGYDTFFLAEHHFHPYGIDPNPAVLLAHIGAKTTRLRLGTAIAALTFRNPVEVAESYALVDQLSGGRLVLGVGSGYLAHEFAGFGIDPKDKRERFDENLAIVRRLLAGERVTFDGKFNRLKDVAINVPTASRDIPILVGVLRAEAAYYVGRQGYDLLAVPYASLESFDEVAKLAAEHRRGLAEAGRTAAPGEDVAVIAFHTFVAETEAEARRVAAEPFDRYVDARLYAKKSTYDDAMRNGLSLMGSVETVADKLVALDAMGVRHVVALGDFGGLAEAHVHASMRLLMNEVMPRVNGRIGAREKV